MHALSQILPHRIDVLHRGGSRPDGTTLPAADARDSRGAGGASGSVRAWGDSASVAVDDPAALGAAPRLTRHHLRAVARACDRTDPTAEVHLLPAADGEPVAVSALLLRHVRAARSRPPPRPTASSTGPRWRAAPVRVAAVRHCPCAAA